MKRLAISGIVLIVLLAGGAQAAGELTLTLVSQNNTTLTLGWTPQPGYGYLFSADGNLVSRTNDPSRNTVKFSKSFSTYEVAAIVKGATGTYPSAPPPPPPPPKAQCEDGLDNDGDGKIDYPNDPGCLSATDNDETDPPPPPPTGQVAMSPTGNDSTCVRNGAACKTWNRAYAVAQSGDTISVANGTYAGTAADLSGSKTVTFQVQSGATAHTGSLEMQGLSNATFNGPIVIDTPVTQNWNLKVWDSSNITLDRLTTKHFNISGSTNVTMTNGDVGNYTALPYGGDSVINKGGNVVFDHMYFHDVQYTSNWGGGHPDCVESSGGFNGITIRNSRFERCGNTFIGFYTDEINGGEWHNVLVENNVFKYVWASVWGIQITNKKPTWPFNCTGIVFRYNTYQPLDPNHQNPDQNYPPPRLTCDDAAVVYGNIIYKDQGGCGTAWTYNMFPAGNACGTNAITGNPLFVNPSAGDLRLQPSSPAINQGDPTRFPPTDFFGTARPQGGRADLGYHEAG